MILERRSKSVIIAEAYRKELLKRALLPDTQVESVDKLAALYQISHKTADKVQRILIEEDLLYRLPGKGTYIKQAPPRELRIGYTWNDLDPFHYSEVAVRHTRLVKRAFREAELKFHPIDYQTLLEKEKWRKIANSFDGLLLDNDFVDEKTLPQLREFTAPVVIIKNNEIETRLIASQVIPDWEKIFTALIPEVNRFRQVLILRAAYPNAVCLDELIRRFFTAPEISTRILDLQKKCEDLHSFFLQRKNEFKNTLLFTLTNTFSEGLRKIYSIEEMPPLIEIDNLEKYCRPSKEHRIFSSIGSEYEQVYARALELLKQHIVNKDESRYVVRIPPKLVVRKSFIPQDKNNKEFCYE